MNDDKWQEEMRAEFEESRRESRKRSARWCFFDSVAGAVFIGTLLSVYGIDLGWALAAGAVVFVVVVWQGQALTRNRARGNCAGSN